MQQHLHGRHTHAACCLDHGAIHTGDTDTRIAQNRKKGFERAVKETPGIEVLASQPGNYRRLPAVQVASSDRVAAFQSASSSSHTRRYSPTPFCAIHAETTYSL